MANADYVRRFKGRLPGVRVGMMAMLKRKSRLCACGHEYGTHLTFGGALSMCDVNACQCEEFRDQVVSAAPAVPEVQPLRRHWAIIGRATKVQIGCTWGSTFEEAQDNIESDGMVVVMDLAECGVCKDRIQTAPAPVLNSQELPPLGQRERQLFAIQAENGRLREQLETAKRLVKGRYLQWGNAGGPKECAHGIALGIFCERCDRALLEEAE